MKRGLLTFLLLITCLFTSGQWVSIPDSNFGNWLLQNYATCIQRNSQTGYQLDTTCNDILSVASVDIHSRNIVSIEGIQYFKNDTALNCSGNLITAIGKLPPNLEYLDCNYNLLSNIPPLPSKLIGLSIVANGLTQLPNNFLNSLKQLDVSDNAIDSVFWLPDSLINFVFKDMSWYLGYLPPRLETLHLENTGIDVLPALPPTLRVLICSQNWRLTELPLLPDSLRYLGCANGVLEGINNFPPLLEYIYCQNNHLQSLPTLPAALKELKCQYNEIQSLSALPTGLSILDCQYNKLTSMPALPPALTELYCQYNNISSFPTSFQNVAWVDCSHNQITTIPSIPMSLAQLDCSYNQIDSMPPSSGMSYLWLDCSHNNITILKDLSYVAELNCSYNKISRLPYLGFTVQSIDCSHNLIDSLPDLTQISDLLSINCSYNRIRRIQSIGNISLNCSHNLIDSLPDLYGLYGDLICDSNLITEIPSSANHLRSLSCSYNQIRELPCLNENLDLLNCSFNPNLRCFSNRFQHVGKLMFQNTQISCMPNRFRCDQYDVDPSTLPLCDPISGCNVFYNISGNIHQLISSYCSDDQGNPGPGLSNVKIQLVQNGQVVQQTYAYSLGEYSFQANTNNSYTIRVDTSWLSLRVGCPDSAIRQIVFTPTDSIKTHQDFALGCIGPDVAVRSISGRFRAGRGGVAYVTAGDFLKNENNANCNVNLSGRVRITINGHARILGAAPGALTPDTLSNDTAIYHITDFSNISLQAFNVVLLADTLAQAGSQICIKVHIDAPGDHSIGNNTLEQCFAVANSFDPNEKSVTPGSVTPSGSWLTYTIHFQNTGNDTAYDIVVRDTFANELDPSKFQFVTSSHPNVYVQLTGNALAVFYPNINLVDSATNPELSSGWFQFRLKSKYNVPVSTQITNKASIYFDFNPAIETNTTSVEVACSEGRAEIYDTICIGTSMQLGNQLISNPGVYVDTTYLAGGCDSVTTLHLAIKYPTDTTIVATICEGDVYSIGYMDYNIDGTYTLAIQNVHGCDSNITLQLSVIPTSHTSITASICLGDTFNFYGRRITQAGYYNQLFNTVNGCDSDIWLHLTVDHVAHNYFSRSICAGDSLFFAGSFKKLAGIYTDTIARMGTCDSVVTLSLVVRPQSQTNIYKAICPNTSYNFAGSILNQPGIYSKTLQGVNYCDSLVILHLTVSPIVTTSGNATICAGSTYTFNGKQIFLPGIYVDTIINAAGCDSVVTINLSVLPVNHDTLQITICQGQSYIFGGRTILNPGWYSDTLQNQLGCDSIIFLSLSWQAPTRSIVTDSICPGESMLFNQVLVADAGIYYDTLTAHDGCDSIVQLNLLLKKAPSIPTLMRVGNVLRSDAPSNQQHQWLLNGAFVSGATDDTLLLFSNGQYSLRIMGSNTCFSTSAEFNVNNLGLLEALEATDVYVYPNPNKGDFTLHAPLESPWQLSDALGRKVGGGITKNLDQHIQIENLAPGAYLISCRTFSAVIVVK